MDAKLFLKVMAVLLGGVLLYMLLMQEIPVLRRGSAVTEVVSLGDSPWRFLGIFAMVGIVEWLLIRKIKSL